MWVRTKIGLARRAVLTYSRLSNNERSFPHEWGRRALLGSAFRRLRLVAAMLDAERLAALRSLEQSLIGRALARQRLLP